MAKHQVLDNSMNPTTNALQQCPTVLDRVKSAFPSARTLCLSAISAKEGKHWDGVEILLKNSCDSMLEYHDGSEEDNLHAAAEECLRQLELTNECPDVTVLYTHAVDAAGHAFGFAPHIRQYSSAIERVDTELAPLIECIRRREAKLHEDWLLLITTDHGGSARSCMPTGQELAFDLALGLHQGISQHECEGVHGLDTSQHKNTFFLTSFGSEVEKGEIIPAPTNADVMPAVLAHFGLSSRNPSLPLRHKRRQTDRPAPVPGHLAPMG